MEIFGRHDLNLAILATSPKQITLAGAQSFTECAHGVCAIVNNNTNSRAFLNASARL